MDERRAQMIDQLRQYLEDLDAEAFGREAAMQANAMPEPVPSEDEGMEMEMPDDGMGGSVRVMEAQIMPEEGMMDPAMEDPAMGGVAPGPMEELSGEPGLDMDGLTEEDLMELEALGR